MNKTEVKPFESLMKNKFGKNLSDAVNLNEIKNVKTEFRHGLINKITEIRTKPDYTRKAF